MIYIKKFLLWLSIALICMTIIFLLLITGAKLISEDGLVSPNTATNLTIDNINLVMVDEATVKYNQQLVIKNGLITEINKAGKPPAQNTTLIKGNNRFITPGLFDMHVHFMDRKALTLTLAHGITSVRIMRGYKMHLRWKEELNNNEWLGSNIYVSSPVLASKNSHVLNQSITSIGHAKKLVRRAKSAGFDLIKAYGYLEPSILNAIINEASMLNFPVAKHGPHPADGQPWTTISSMQSLEHVEDIFQGPMNYTLDLSTLPTIVAKIKQLNVPVTPTLAGFAHLTKISKYKKGFTTQLPLQLINPLKRKIEEEYSVTRWLSDTEQESDFHKKKLTVLMAITKELHQQQVPLLVGSDTGTMYTIAGETTHQEMQLMQDAGIPPLDIIKAATIAPAKALAIDQKYGTITIGKVADLVVTQHDPSKNIQHLKHPHAVIKQGQWLSQTSLDTLTKSAEKHPNIWVTFLLILEDIALREFDDLLIW